jgi:hypothetical protein
MEKNKYISENANKYLSERMVRIEKNNRMLEELRLQRLGKSFSASIESDKANKRKNKGTVSKDNDVDYTPGEDVDGNDQQDKQPVASKTTNQKVYISISQSIYCVSVCFLTIRLAETKYKIHCSNVHQSLC